VRLTRTEDGICLDVADPAGAPVLSLGSLTSRPLSIVPAAVGRDVLYRVAWTQLPLSSRPDVPAVDTIETADGLLVPAGYDNPPWVLFHATSGPLPDDAGPADLSQRLRDLVGRTLRALHVFLAEPAWERSRLIIHTHGAVDLDTPVDPASAAVWGLVRTAQTEHPDRFILLDAAPTWGNAGALAGMWQHESQFALREDTWWTPRLVSAADEPNSTELNPDGTVLITGGTGGIGAVVARHMAAEHGIRHLILASRRGADADGAAELRADLEASGAHIDIVACDIADRDQVRALLARVPADAPLTAVIHSAAVTDDGVITALDSARLDTVFAPKADGALHLDELTRDLDLAAFVLFSSVSGLVGAPGQGNYAAANAFLDALATRRRAAGYPAISLAWGLWALASGLAGGQDLTTDVALLKRFGLRPIDPPQGLRLLDVALRSPRATLAPVALDVTALRTQARSHPMPTILHTVIGPVRRTADATGPNPNTPGTLRTRLAGLDTTGRLAALTELVQTEAAAEIGYDTPQDIGARRPFRQFGFDSLTAVGLRNRLTDVTGLRLPAALIYDHETPAAVADLLMAGLTEDSKPTPPAPAQVGDLSFGQVYRTLLELNRHDDMQRLGLSAAAGRVAFDHSSELDGGARIIRLSEGGHPHLICIPPVTSVNAMSYSRLANHFTGRNDLSVIMPPGFTPDEPLASSFDVLVEALADATVRCARDTPFILMGISGGGCLAHSVAEHLERGGVKPEAVIYLDSYLPDAVSPRLLEFLVQEYPRQEEFLGEYDYPKITAAAVYTSMLEGWQPHPVLASALVLRPTEPLPGPGGSTEPLADHEWHTEWPLEHDEIQVPGHHFSMCTTYAATTAEAIHRWLTDSCQEKGTSK
jgi:thioesterase domain-containing protein/NADP-dependent 3-hydroxy acid dehydrogenase YdfG